MASKGIVGLLVLTAVSSVMGAVTISTVPAPDTNINTDTNATVPDTNATVPVSTLDDSSNAPNVSSTTVKPSTALSTSTEMAASNTTSQPTTEGTTTVPKSTTAIPETTTAAPAHTRHFDGWSFLGGILLTVAAAGLLMGGYKYFGPGRGDKGVYNRIGMKDLYGESDHLQV